MTTRDRAWLGVALLAMMLTAGVSVVATRAALRSPPVPTTAQDAGITERSTVAPEREQVPNIAAIPTPSASVPVPKVGPSASAPPARRPERPSATRRRGDVVNPWGYD